MKSCPERDQRICALYEQGLLLKDIAKDVGFTPSGVHVALRRHGYARPPRSVPMQDRVSSVVAAPPKRREYQTALTAEQLRARLHYDPVTGLFTRRVAAGGRAVGSVAGTVASVGNGRSYIYIHIHGKRYLASRLAWLYMAGAWPTLDVDHENTDSLDNRWSNLRVATPTQNIGNSVLAKNNTSGYKGVFFASHANSWRARIIYENKAIHLGYFKCIEQAHAAYAKAAGELFGEFARV